MRNDVVVTIEGRRDSVKGKGKLHAVVVEYFKYKGVHRISGAIR
jgi:hypothetical protein